jgi:peptidoglycan/xylan/chitin deacetylase (PgdA/CDA1 family)
MTTPGTAPRVARAAAAPRAATRVLGSAAASAAALAAAAWVAPAPAAHSGALCDLLGIVRCLDLGSDGVGMTFDDGPHREGTPAVLDALARAGAQATFFVVGEQVRREPQIVREIAAAGHRLAVHGDRHVALSVVTPARLRTDLDRCADLIGELTGQLPDRYRPPYGVFSPAGLLECRRRGWTPLLWSAWGRDWRAGATPDSIAARVTRTLRAGDVVLLHDADHYSSPGSWRRTADAVPRIIEVLGSRGLRAVAL